MMALVAATMALTMVPLPANSAPNIDVDPLVGRILRTCDRRAFATLNDYSAVAAGLSVWKRTLAAGRCPDFEGVDAAATAWPPQPLLGALTDVMSDMGLPRATERHPSLAAAALAAVLDAAVRFAEKRAADADVSTSIVVPTANDESDTSEHEPVSDECEDAHEFRYEAEAEAEADAEAEAEGNQQKGNEEYEARQLADALAREWSAPLQGVRAVEGLGAAAGGDVGLLTAAPGTTFSPADGLWCALAARSFPCLGLRLGPPSQTDLPIQLSHGSIHPPACPPLSMRPLCHTCRTALPRTIPQATRRLAQARVAAGAPARSRRAQSTPLATRTARSRRRRATSRSKHRGR